MSKAIRFDRTGGPEVLREIDIDVGLPGPGQVLLKHVAVGINFADTYFRNGTYPVPLPSGIGVEASGIVEAVGPEVTNLREGSRVSYTGFVDMLGAYSERRVVNAAQLISLPDEIPLEVAAASTMRGLTAAYLLLRLHPFHGNETVLIHAAAGGLGLILVQWAKLLGLKVIGTVSNENKAHLALQHGADHVINYSTEDVAGNVRNLTDGRGVDVVFDGVGHNTFNASLDSLRRRGLLVCVGTASGSIPPFNPQILAIKGSLFLTRPALADYIADPVEKANLSQAFFGLVTSGRLKVEVHKRYALSEAVQAHRDLESRRTTGSSIFVIPQ